MIDNYPNLKKLLNKYNLAVNSNSKEIRISTIELGLILQDITELSVSVTNQNNANVALKHSVDMLVELIKEMTVQDDSF
jgi:uncharacterized coiled-coil protein SlyX